MHHIYNIYPTQPPPPIFLDQPEIIAILETSSKSIALYHSSLHPEANATSSTLPHHSVYYIILKNNNSKKSKGSNFYTNKMLKHSYIRKEESIKNDHISFQ